MCLCFFSRNQAQFLKYSRNCSHSLLNYEMCGWEHFKLYYKCPSPECSYLNVSYERYPHTKCSKQGLK